MNRVLGDVAYTGVRLYIYTNRRICTSTCVTFAGKLV